MAFLDCLPIVEHLDRITPEFATAWWHWFFFAQPDLPERVINADPDTWYGARSPGKLEQMGVLRRGVSRPQAAVAPNGKVTSSVWRPFSRRTRVASRACARIGSAPTTASSGIVRCGTTRSNAPS